MADLTAKATSILVDILGFDHFAGPAVKKARDDIEQTGHTVTAKEEMLMRIAALQTAELVLDEIRKFAERGDV